MKRILFAIIAVLLLAPSDASAQRGGFDYWGPQREMVQRGVQAILQCNGLFTSNRTLEQVFDQELAYVNRDVGTPEAGRAPQAWIGRPSWARLIGLSTGNHPSR